MDTARAQSAAGFVLLLDHLMESVPMLAYADDMIRFSWKCWLLQHVFSRWRFGGPAVGLTDRHQWILCTS